MMSAWFVNSECNFMKFVELCLVPCVLPDGQGWGEKGCMSVLSALLASLSVRSLPGMPTWPGSQQR